MFQIKDFSSISASMVNWMRAATKKVTDFNVGSVVRTLVEAAAIEIDELYQRMFIGLKEAIPVSVYNSFDFAALPANTAGGLVHVIITAQATDTLIAGGTTFTPTGSSASYTASTDVTITAGNTYADVPVICTATGSIGNIPAGAAFTLGPVTPGFVSAANQAAFVGGRDAETDTERKLRFGVFIKSLARGTNDALRYGLSTVQLTDSQGNLSERVVYAAVDEPYLRDTNQPVGLVNCYIHNGIGSTSGALIALARTTMYGYTDASTGLKVPGWKAAGVHVEVYAATEQAINVTATVTSDAGYVHATVLAAVSAALSNYLLTLPIGQAAILAKMTELAMETDGVTNIVFTAPLADTVSAFNVKPMPGTVALT